LTQAGQHDLPMLLKAVTMFEVGHDAEPLAVKDSFSCTSIMSDAGEA
jgi:hypothetical protein